MSQVAAYSTLYPLVLPHLPGYDERLVAQAFKRVGRDFAQKSNAWREDLPPLAVNDYQQDYRLSVPTSSFPHRIWWVKVNNSLIDQDDYELYEEDVLRFYDVSTPWGLENMLLTCGTCSKTAATDWAGVTDGSVGITLAGTANDITDLDFSGATTMDDVARIIQNGLRTETEETYGFVRWDEINVRFYVYTEQQTVSYLTAGSAGTDISGSDYMNGLTGGTGVTLGGYILVNAVLRPHAHADVLPDWVLDRWHEQICDGVLADLLAMPKKPWTNPTEARRRRYRYRAAIGQAKGENIRGQRRTSPGLLG